jgi:hypothetical protein
MLPYDYYMFTKVASNNEPRTNQIWRSLDKLLSHTS